jgi:hypothetical protein
LIAAFIILPHGRTSIATVISSAFSAILVFAQELLPRRIGMVSGLFFGLAFGFGGIGAAVLGGRAGARVLISAQARRPSRHAPANID